MRTYADLAQVPGTLYGREFREAQGRFHPNDLVCAEQVRLWMKYLGHYRQFKMDSRRRRGYSCLL